LADFEWLVLAGGSGSRSENPVLPKILQDVGGLRVIDLLLNALAKTGSNTRVTFVLRHGKSEVQSYLENADPDLNWRVHEDLGVGPVEALASAALEIESSIVGCILGDTAIRAPLDWFLHQHLASERDASVVVRQSDHLIDSDAFELDYQGNTIAFRGKQSKLGAPKGQLWGASGILFAKRDLATSLINTEPDIASALVRAIGAQQIRCIRSSFYHRDTGTPDRIASIRRDAERRSQSNHNELFNSRRALFVDRDGTLMPDLPGGRKSLELSEVDPKVARTIAIAKSNGVPVFLATNQPAIAKGFIGFDDVYRVHNKLQEVLADLEGVVIDDFIFCPHHPELGHSGEIPRYKVSCGCRKPMYGMFLELAQLHKIDLSNSILLGDSWSDEGAADGMGMKFLNVLEYKDEQITSLWCAK